MTNDEKKIAKITGTVLKLDKKKIKGNEITLFLVARNELGAEIEIPVDAERGITIKVNTKGGMKQVEQFSGNLQVKANHIENVIARAEVQVNSYRVGTLIANQTTLGSTREISTCFTGCMGAHVNDQQRKITVRKSTRNPFDEECPIEIGPGLRQNIELFKILLPSETENDIKSVE